MIAWCKIHQWLLCSTNRNLIDADEELEKISAHMMNNPDVKTASFRTLNRLLKMSKTAEGAMIAVRFNDVLVQKNRYTCFVCTVSSCIAVNVFLTVEFLDWYASTWNYATSY